MRSDWWPLAPTFRSPLQARLLALLLLPDTGEWTISDAARALDAPLTSVHSEIERLASVGILTSRKVGRSRVVGANRDHPMHDPLFQLALIAAGPQFVVEQEFAGLGAHAVLIFGSWAARFHGEAGWTPRDIDVLVVGGIAREDAYAAAERAEVRLGTPVNAVVRSEAAWSAEPPDALVADIRARPIVRVSP